MPVFDHFDLLAPFYERFIHPRPPEELLAHLALPVQGALLDAGGGTGRVSQFLREYARMVVVADLSCRMLAQARRKAGLLPVCSHSERLPFPDEAFARIIMVDALHHVCDQRATARELWRLLQTGGRLVIEEPDLRRFAVKGIALAEKLALMRSHFLAPAQIAALFDFPQARVSIASGEFNVWIVVEKPASPSEG